MSIANSTERLFFYTLQESNLNLQVSNIQMQLLSATKSLTDENLAFSQEQQNLYYDDVFGYDANPEIYTQQAQDLRARHEDELAKITNWEMVLETQKNDVETRLNQIKESKSSIQSMLKKDIQTDFAYGGVSGGK